MLNSMKEDKNLWVTLWSMVKRKFVGLNFLQKLGLLVLSLEPPPLLEKEPLLLGGNNHLYLYHSSSSYPSSSSSDEKAWFKFFEKLSEFIFSMASDQWLTKYCKDNFIVYKFFLNLVKIQ